MASSNFVIRPATAADVAAWYGKKQALTCRLLVGEVDGEVIALGGVYRDKDSIIAIAGMKPAMRKRKKDIVRMARAVKRILNEYPNVVALADQNEASAPSFLRHLGFIYQGRFGEQETYLWTR